MTIDQGIRITIIVNAIIIFIFKWISFDLAGIVIIAYPIISGILSPIKAMMHLSNSAAGKKADMFFSGASIIKTAQLNRIRTCFSKIYIIDHRPGTMIHLTRNLQYAGHLKPGAPLSQIFQILKWVPVPLYYIRAIWKL